jgi:hypothetical protein
MVAISYDEMSKSFKDAIVVARALGIRYLWIDSLCICQDDYNDWEREAAKMGSVYSNSYLTISITGAKVGTIGCFVRRSPKGYVKIAHTSKDGTQGDLLAFILSFGYEAFNSEYITMDEEPLSDRGWCFQERVLSRRIVHFATDHMYFECMEGFRGESGLYLSRRYNRVHGSGDSYLPRQCIHSTNSVMDEWYALLWGYCSRKLTKDSDKLPALSRIAEFFSERLNDQYIAGIWRKSMIEGLLWQGIDLTKALENGSPPWSWASVNGIPASGLYDRWEPLATVLDYHVELVGQNPYGGVKSGRIKLETPLLQLFLAEDEEGREEDERGDEDEEDEEGDEDEEDEGDEEDEEDEEGDEDEKEDNEEGAVEDEEVDDEENEEVAVEDEEGDEKGDEGKINDAPSQDKLNPELKRIYLRTQHGNPKGAPACFDLISNRHMDSFNLVKGLQIFALVLAVDVGDPTGRIMNYHSLLVTPTGDQGKSMKRIGWILQEIESLGIDEARSSHKTVILV